jgi:hypothetical protein
MDASQYKDYILILLCHTDENFLISWAEVE